MKHILSLFSSFFLTSDFLPPGGTTLPEDDVEYEQPPKLLPFSLTQNQNMFCLPWAAFFPVFSSPSSFKL